MLQKPRDAVVFAVMIMIPAYFIADRAKESSLVATPSALEEQPAMAKPAPRVPEPVEEFGEDLLEVDDWYNEAGIEDVQEQPEFVAEAVDHPAPDRSGASGFEADIRGAVAAMDAR
jgi:hypothetical protein